jgi:hypothetical protein
MRNGRSAENAEVNKNNRIRRPPFLPTGKCWCAVFTTPVPLAPGITLRIKEELTSATQKNSTALRHWRNRATPDRTIFACQQKIVFDCLPPN